jgi:uncharacterized protein YegP (UPF0339 family)
MAAKFVIKTAKNGEFHFSLHAGNGESILSSEMYKTKSSCTNGINSVQKNCAEDSRYERKTSSNKKHYFNLKASNGQVIGKSEMYESASGLENGIASVKKNGTTTTIVDE